MIEELIAWDPFFKQFKREGKEKPRYQLTPFNIWMNKNFPQVKPIDRHNLPHYEGLKRKRS